MQLSDREIQNTLDLLRKKQSMGPEGTIVFSDEEVAGIQEIIRRIEKEPEVRRDRVEKVRKQLESSSYDVTGDDVAKKLIGRMISDKLH